MAVHVSKLDPYFARAVTGPPFNPGEEMKYELIRLWTFQNWPSWSPARPIKLAKVGFYFTGQKDEVACYRCRHKKEKWEAGDSPLEEHRKLDPRCLAVTGADPDNVPVFIPEDGGASLERIMGRIDAAAIGTVSEQRDRDSLLDNTSISSTNSGGEQENSSASGPRSQSVENVIASERSATPPPQQRTPPQRRPGSSVADRAATPSRASNSPIRAAPAADPATEGRDIGPPMGEELGPLRYERNRLDTFRNFPANAAVQSSECARAGFNYTGPGDRVQCVFCRGVLRNWENGDQPHIEHKRHFPRCPFVLGMGVG
jgi:hypothetical protein